MLTRAGLPGGCRPACRSSIIDETNALLCRPLGALYSYIQNARIGVELEDRDVPVPITALNTFTCNDLLLLSRKHPTSWTARILRCYGAHSRRHWAVEATINPMNVAS